MTGFVALAFAFWPFWYLVYRFSGFVALAFAFWLFWYLVNSFSGFIGYTAYC